MIYDAVHQAVLLHEGHKTQLLELAAPLELPPPSAREQQFQALWTQFYKTLEIKARHNEKGRMTHCPKRFWADMVEMQGGVVAPHSVCSLRSQPPSQGDGFRVGGKLCGIAIRRPLGGAVAAGD